jgi:hypothetical protein
MTYFESALKDFEEEIEDSDSANESCEISS